jgi:zinc protease
MTRHVIGRILGAALVAGACVVALARPAGAQAVPVGSGGAPLPVFSESEPVNPFEVFESFRLPNGLRVWYGYLPGSTVTSLGVHVPVGRDHDPGGREQTAHFLEHVLFSDRHGRAEAELSRELTSRGGSHSGITGATYTQYLVSIGSDQAGYGLSWLHDVVAPRVIAEHLVARNRRPVAIEIGARGGSMLSGPLATWVLHPRLRPPGFWRREFGVAAQEERGADQHAGIAAITAADLQTFYDTYYAPPVMTLVIVSGVPRVALQAVLDSTFGSLPWRPPPPDTEARAVRTGESRAFTWHAAGSSRVALRFRFADLTDRDHLRLVFIEDLLRHRLMERLRRGDSKIVYSVSSSIVTRGPVGFLGIHADVGAGDETAVRRIIAEELDRLATADADTAAFYRDRDALSRRLRIENASPAALRNWALNRFQQPAGYDAFPDLGEYYATVGPDSIAAAAGRLFIRDNRIVRVARPLPLPPWALALTALLVVLAAASLVRRVSFHAADMSAIRYVARIRPAPAERISALFAGALGLLVVGRILAAGVHVAAVAWIAPLDSFPLHAGAAAALLFAITLGALATVASFPRKILVFEDEVRLKSRSWHAVIIPRVEIRAARLVPAATGLRLRRPVFRQQGDGVFLELRDGSGYLLRTRAPDRLHQALLRLCPDAAPPLAATASHAATVPAAAGTATTG